MSLIYLRDHIYKFKVEETKINITRATLEVHRQNKTDGEEHKRLNIYRPCRHDHDSAHITSSWKVSEQSEKLTPDETQVTRNFSQFSKDFKYSNML